MAVVIERGYKMEITSTGIEFSGQDGGATAVWALASLISTLNDGSEHFLVADFQNEGGTTWRLKTSLDGANWVDQGTQTGPTPASVTDTDPTIELTDASADTWADEVVMWVGHQEFNSFELENLFDLGDTFGQGMDQYGEHYDAPICWQATAVLPDGTVWRDSGSGPCPAVIRVPRGASDVVVTDDGLRTSPRIVEG